MGDTSIDLKKGIERISLVDLSSSEDDLLMSSSSSPSVDGSLAAGKSDVNGPTNTLGKENSDNCLEETEQGPVQPKKRAPEKLNLRKSLAWDNAFFTSEGVLDSEELAMVNSTLRKAEPHVLPVIEEDMKKSFESTATFDSDNLTVESIESELFGNLRASIQKSYDKCDQAPTIEQPGKVTVSRKADVHGIGLHEQASRKTKISSKIGGKPPMDLKRDGINKSRPNETPKELSSSQKAASGKGNKKLVTKQQRIPPGATTAPIRPGATTAPIKKASIPLLIQVERSMRKASEGNACGRPSEIPTSDEPRVVPKSSCGSSNLTSSNKGLSSASCSSTSRPGRISDQTRKISLDPSRKKVDNKNSVKSSSNSGMKYPHISENKINAKSQKTHLKFSPVSPSSSIESVESSCSSASTATIGTRSLSSYGSEGISSQPNEDKYVHHSLSDMAMNISGAPLGRLSVGSSPGACLPKVSGPSDQFASANASSETKLSKPSGLRIPRPKIGYFDAEKSLAGKSSKYRVASQSAIPGSTSTIGRSGTLKTMSAGAPLKTNETLSPLCSETVLQPTASLPVSSSSKVGDPVATAAIEMPSRFSHDQTVMVNDRVMGSKIQDSDSGADESRKIVGEVGDGVNAAGYDAYSTSDATCLDPHELPVAPAKASEDKLQGISVPLEAFLKENNFTKKASLTSEKPSSMPSPCISKNVQGYQENIHGQLAKNIGKENLSLLGNQMD